MTVEGAIAWLSLEKLPLHGETGMREEAINIAIESMNEVEQYRALGTVEELKEAREKQIPKKPRFYAHNYYCTECGNLVGNNEFKWQRFLYCDKCGQALKWGDEND